MNTWTEAQTNKKNQNWQRQNCAMNSVKISSIGSDHVYSKFGLGFSMHYADWCSNGDQFSYDSLVCSLQCNSVHTFGCWMLHKKTISSLINIDLLIIILKHFVNNVTTNLWIFIGHLMVRSVSPCIPFGFQFQCGCNIVHIFLRYLIYALCLLLPLHVHLHTVWSLWFEKIAYLVNELHSIMRAVHVR